MKIEVTITFRGVSATSYENAKQQAYAEMMGSLIRRRLLAGLGVFNFADFQKASRAFKEADDTYTVVMP